MADHGPDCPACQVGALSHEDRMWLSAQGWDPPEHVVPERPGQPRDSPVLAFLVVCAGLVLLALWLNSPLWGGAVTLVSLAGGWSWFGWHRVRHPVGRRRLACLWCRRSVRTELEDRWARLEQWRRDRRLMEG